MLPAMPKATTSSRATHPFPFFGAGRANYFEWAEVHVRFARAPAPAERKAIAAIVPPPLRDSVRFHGRDLHVASGQFVHHNIYDAYALPDDPVNDENDDDDEIEDGWFFASTAQVDRFNTATEHWLHAAHKIVPIFAAFRREDGEAGGTKLSTWHRKSLAQTAEVLRGCEDVLALGDRYAAGAYMLHGILDMAEDGGVAVPDEWKHWHDSPETEAAKRTKTSKATAKKTSTKTAAAKDAEPARRRRTA